MNANLSLAVALTSLALSCSHPAAPPEAPSSAAPSTPASATSPVSATPRPSVLEAGAIRTPAAAPRLPASQRGGTRPGGLDATPVARAPATPDDVRVRLTRVASDVGEDGHGNTVRATAPVAIDLERASGWQAGALTTTLHVGALSFYSMGYPEVTTMRFIVADGSTLPRDAVVSLQYGPDPERRRVLAHALPVTP